MGVQMTTPEPKVKVAGFMRGMWTMILLQP
jgi:hypothetical protein